MSIFGTPVARLATTKENTGIDVDVYYDKGGSNFFLGTQEKRGIDLSAGPTKRDGHTIAIGILSGIKVLLEETKAASPKKLLSHKNAVAADVGARRGQAWDLVLRALAKNGLELAAEQPKHPA